MATKIHFFRIKGKSDEDDDDAGALAIKYPIEKTDQCTILYTAQAYVYVFNAVVIAHSNIPSRCNGNRSWFAKTAKVNSGLHKVSCVCMCMNVIKVFFLLQQLQWQLYSTMRANTRRAGEQRMKKNEPQEEQQNTRAPNKWCGE